MAERKKAGRHLGLALTPEVSAQLDDLIQAEQAKVGDIVQVSASAMAVALITRAHKAAFPKKTK